MIRIEIATDNAAFRDDPAAEAALHCRDLTDRAMLGTNSANSPRP